MKKLTIAQNSSFDQSDKEKNKKKEEFNFFIFNGTNSGN